MLQHHGLTQAPIAPPADARRDLLRTSHFALAGELVGAVVHDLRQPVTAMTVNVEVAIELLQRRPTDVKGALAALEDALDGGRQLGSTLRVVHNLVARRNPERTTVTMDSVLAETMRLVQTEANARRVEVSVLSDAGLPALQLDASMIRQAMLSMLLDAVENCAATGKVHVRLGLMDSGAVELTVRHLRQTDAPLEDGWELAVARCVCEAHGVALRIERTADGGVTVGAHWPISGSAPAGRHVM